LLEGRTRPAGAEPVEGRLPLGQRTVAVGVLAERDEPRPEQAVVTVLVVELPGQELADLALGHVRDPGGDQLDGPELVVDALAHAVPDLLEAKRRGRVRVEADVAVPPEARVLLGERATKPPAAPAILPGSGRPACPRGG